MLEFENERYVGVIPSGGGGGSAVIKSLSVTPSTSAQTFNASNVDGYKPVTVSAVTSAIDNNIVAGNIVSGVSILGVNGSAIELNATTENVTPTTSSQTVTPTSPYNGFSSVTVNGVTAAIDNNITASNIKDGVTILGVTGEYVGTSPVIDSLSITPTTSAQTITAQSGIDGYSPINVSAVTSSIDANITAQNIVSGVSILGVSGSATVLNGETLSVTPTTSAQTLTPTSPKNGFTEVSVSAVTSAIDQNITAGNIKKDVVILGVTGSYEGSGGGGGGKYALLDRVSDDGGNEIGTVSGFFTDSNDVEYAVVCLDAQYRLESGTYCSNKIIEVTDLPAYPAWEIWEAKETATFNTQKILDFCTAQSATSTACTHCRSKSFTIDGTTYYGQLPNFIELVDICKNYTAIQSADTSVSQYSGLGFPRTSDRTWSSSQSKNSSSWGINMTGISSNNLSKDVGYFVAPVLEIPNT